MSAVTALTSRPPRELLLLMSVAVIDLIVTVVLFKLDLIIELNPIMRPLLEKSPLLFSAVKMSTLVAAYVALQLYRRVDERFVRTASGYGAGAYVLIWAVWTGIGNFGPL